MTGTTGGRPPTIIAPDDFDWLILSHRQHSTITLHLSPSSRYSLHDIERELQQVMTKLHGYMS